MMYDRNAERAVLAVCYQKQRFDILDKLDTEDFLDDVHKIILCELKNMHAFGEPFDSVAVIRWFSQDRVAKRAVNANIGENIRDLATEVLPSYATEANLWYYLKVLRIERLRRDIRDFTIQLTQENDRQDHDPTQVIQWAEGAITTLKQKGEALVYFDTKRNTGSPGMDSQGQKGRPGSDSTLVPVESEESGRDASGNGAVPIRLPATAHGVD